MIISLEKKCIKSQHGIYNYKKVLHDSGTILKLWIESSINKSQIQYKYTLPHHLRHVIHQYPHSCQHVITYIHPYPSHPYLIHTPIPPMHHDTTHTQPYSPIPTLIHPYHPPIQYQPPHLPTHHAAINQSVIPNCFPVVSIL